MFSSEIQNNHAPIKEEEDNYKTIPFIRQVSANDILENYQMIKREVSELIESELVLIEKKRLIGALNVTMPKV